jgi:hypothetical protein
MHYLVNFARFWYDFIVGDDWTVAVGVVVALAATGALVRLAIPAWWLMPLAVTVLLLGSLWRASRASH